MCATWIPHIGLLGFGEKSIGPFCLSSTMKKPDYILQPLSLIYSRSPKFRYLQHLCSNEDVLAVKKLWVLVFFH